jgi:signal transduction histidine kinase
MKYKNGKYVFANESMLKTINVSNEQIGGIDDEHLPNIFQVKKITEADKLVFEKGENFYNDEFVEINGKIKYFISSKKPLYNKKKEIIGLIGSSMDITEIKEAQIKAEKEKEYELSFNQNYVHEVNNIFHKKTQIKYLLSVESISEKEKADLLVILEHEDNKLCQLTQNFSLHHNNLLQEKEIFLEKKSVNIIKLIEKEIRYFNLCYKYLNQDRIIIFEKSLDNLELTIDEIKISQVVHNLIKNADKHSESTKINVSLRVLDDICYLSFDDNGIGIGREIDKESLFIVDKNKKITKSGSGLGLPICKSIVKEHGGDIYFKEVEKGVAIEFWLPY